MQIVILAGGLGQRLKKIIGNRPKILTNFNDKTFLEIQLLRLIESKKIKSIVYLTGKGHSEIKKEIAKLRINNKIPLNIIEDFEIGAGGGKSIIDALPLLSDRFILIFGDSLPKINLNKFYSWCVKYNLFFAMTYIDKNLVNEEANIKIVKNKLIYFTNNKLHKNLNYVDYGVYFFNKSAFKSIKYENHNDYKMLVKKLTSIRKFNFFEVKHPFIEFGNPTAYYNCLELLRNERH